MGKFDLNEVLQNLGDGADAEPLPGPGDAGGPPERASADGDPPQTIPGDEDLETGLARREQNSDVGLVLLDRGIISSENLSDAKRVVRQTPGKTIENALVELGTDESELMAVVAEMAMLPFERLDPEQAESYDLKSINRLGLVFCKENLILPLRKEGARLVVGTNNPDDVFLLDDVKRRLGVRSIKHILVAAEDVLEVLEALGQDKAEEYDVNELLADVDEDDVELVKDEADDPSLEDAESSPVVRYVNHIIQTAMNENASDIHIEPDEKSMKVRFRIDGVLFEMMNPPRKMHSALTSRIKIMANLDIAERRLPQDGRIRATVHGRKLDLRVSTIPTPKGEKTVMRILDTRSINVPLDHLGFGEDTLTIWKNQIAQPHGIILVTGPTGSGKTTTLYASLQEMDLRRLNISTVEDPVEYNVPNITQIQTHEKIGMTFAAALRSMLRQDPDVVMVGEIRDMETAQIAIQAALTGHLVLSTLHTNDAPASVTRLINIGIEPFLVGAALNSVLAQRLARRICENCKTDDQVPPEVQEFLDMHGVSASSVKRGTGCNRCRETGYSGRCGLYEMLLLDDFLRDKVASNPNVTEFRRICAERGMVSLRQDGFVKVSDGITTVEEVMRITEATI